MLERHLLPILLFIYARNCKLTNLLRFVKKQKLGMAYQKQTNILSKLKYLVVALNTRMPVENLINFVKLYALANMPNTSQSDSKCS